MELDSLVLKYYSCYLMGSTD